MVIGDGIVYADAVAMVNSFAAVVGLVVVSHTLTVQRMVSLMLHLAIA